MTDRELLERAAKAAGYTLPGRDDHDEIGRQYCEYLGLWVGQDGRWGWWRPHHDDGHALRLAVRLHIRVYPPEPHLGENHKRASTNVYGKGWWGNDVDADPYAATRLAILRAAAAMAGG